MFSFIGGFMAGAFVVKYYNDTCSDGDEELSKERSSRITSSRASVLKQSVAKQLAYNEFDDHNNINFLSDIVARLWPHLNEAATTMVREMIEPSFKDLPNKLSTLRFRKLDLGDVPLVLDNILVHEVQKIEDGSIANGKYNEYIQFEWDVTWHSKCDIQLATEKIGGVAAISFGVKGFSLSGRLQVIAKPLSSVLPCIDAVQFAFVNPPQIELDFTGLANVADMKLKIGSLKVVDIKGLVRGIVNDTLAQSVVLPQRTVAPLASNVDYRDIFFPAYIGLARVRLHSGRGFEIQKATTPFGKDDVPDVYLKIRLGAEKFFKSSVVKDNCEPEWDPDAELHDFLFCSTDQIIEVQAWDRDSGMDGDDFLGVAYMTVGQVLLQSGRNGKYEIQLMQPAKTRGKNDTPTEQYVTISLETLSFTTKDLSSLNVEDKNLLKDGNKVIGLTTVLISHASDLPFAKEEDANTFVKLWSGTGPSRVEIGVTPAIPNSLNPEYQTPFSIPLTVSGMANANANKDLMNYSLEMLQQDPSDGTEKSLGEIVVNHNEVRNENSKVSSLRESRSIGKGDSKTKLAFSISFAGVSCASGKKILLHSDEGKSQSDVSGGEVEVDVNGEVSQDLTTENKIQVTIVGGYGFESERKARFRKSDIPDIYCLVKFGSSPSIWRTATIKDSENPKWENETRDYIMESANQVISIDVWDENRKSDDDYYGQARTSVGKVLLNGGRLDVEVKSNNSLQNGNVKKLMSGMGISGGSGVVRKNKGKMFITVECSRL